MAFIPFRKAEGSRLSILVDSYARIQLSAGLHNRLAPNGEELNLILFFEPETRRIGIAKTHPGQEQYKIFRVDSRRYMTVRDFLMENDIEFLSGSTKYYYDGTVDGVMTFKASKPYTKPIKTTLRQEKNGNLEKLG